ncbi:MAG TPA: NHL repeat-containing protein [Thermoanaerobaculia bacterium]|nr:NHL repeat-containing protein [Thermoanaerobaculia bacterium]
MILCLASAATAASFTFNRYAGRDGGGYADGSRGEAAFFYPQAIATDLLGNLYIADAANDVIRKITPDGLVSTLAGAAGLRGTRDGVGAEAWFDTPQGVAVDSTGMVYVADTGNQTIRRITQDGMVTTFAGRVGVSGWLDAAGINAEFRSPIGLAFDSSDTLYVADYNNHAIRKIDRNGVVSTFAGNPNHPGFSDGFGRSAFFLYPFGVASFGSLVFVTDSANNVVREILSSGEVKTVYGSPTEKGNRDGVGSTALFSRPTGITVDQTGVLYVTDTDNHQVRRLSPDLRVVSIAGSGVRGASDGVGSAAQFDYPFGITIDSLQRLFVADTLNQFIRVGTEEGTAPPPPIPLSHRGRGARR